MPRIAEKAAMLGVRAGTHKEGLKRYRRFPAASTSWSINEK